ncbi:MAG: ATP-binding cassette domain-containing protein [Solirubrobacterales bacterium]|nr:ATP-binding cassette domain-containing protein [Solirubrobacterales bacterium]
MSSTGNRGRPGAMTPPLALRDLEVSVPDGRERRVLLDHTNLEVGAGEVVVVTGASGSGKSTLLALAGLLRRPDSGEVMISGQPTSTLGERQRTDLRRREIAIVYQSANLLPSLTASEQLELVGHINRERRDTSRERARVLLDELGLTDRRGQLPGKMSGGERQRVGIARALMAEPSVLLADEPTASLDRDLSVQIAELLAFQTTSRGLATVIVSHDETPLEYADRHLHLEGGKLEAVVLKDG